MTLVQFQVFLAVIEEKSFTRAAEKLNMTQSAVSQTISALESELGVTLVIRNRTGVSLTYIGERMQTHARDVLNLVRCMEDEASAAKRLDKGTLRVGCLSSIAANVIPGVFKSFNEKYPKIRLKLFEGTQREIREWLSTGSVDVGFVEAGEETSFTTVFLFEDPLCAFVPSLHPLARRASVHVSELVAEPFIFPMNDAHALIEDMLRTAGAFPQVSYQVRETATILAMVEQGIGVTVLPELDSAPFCAANVVKVPLIPSTTRKIGLGVRNLERISPVEAEFVLHCKAMFPSKS